VANAPVHADAPVAVDPVDAALDQVRDMLERGDVTAARAALRVTYEQHPRPDLLFALGQVELNLGNYAAAIDYYEKFIETGPSEEQIALAQQAIGAARALVTTPPAPPPPAPPPPPPPRLPPPRFERDWDVWSSAVTVAGSLAILGGAGIFAYGYQLGTDHGGTLAQYEDRRDRSRTMQYLGTGIAAGGVVLVTAMLVRYGVHRVEVAPTATASSVGIAIGSAW